MKRSGRSTLIFTKQINNDIKRIYRDTRKIIWTRRSLSTQAGGKKSDVTASRSEYYYTLIIRQERIKNCQSIVPESWKGFQENPERIIEYENRYKQMRNGAEKVKLMDSEEDPLNLLLDHTVQQKDNVLEKLMVKKQRHTSTQNLSLQCLLTLTQRTYKTMIKNKNI